MNISEARLREIVLEEVSVRLLQETINQVIAEMALPLTEEEKRQLGKTVLDALKSVAVKSGKPLAVLALLAFGSEVASNLQILDGVGVTPSSAEQIQHGQEAAMNITDARLQALDRAIVMGSLEGEIPADLEKGVDSVTAKDTAMDRLDSEYVQQGAWDTTGRTQSGTSLVYVPYDSLPDGYKDTYTRGAEKEDLKTYYQTMDIQSLAKMVKDLNQWGSEGHGKFKTVEIDGDPVKLLRSDFSIAYKALQDKTATRGAKGKDLFEENA
jgi:hypothetical protein